jgi:hypothetical protein
MRKHMRSTARAARIEDKSTGGNAHRSRGAED